MGNICYLNFMNVVVGGDILFLVGEVILEERDLRLGKSLVVRGK